MVLGSRGLGDVYKRQGEVDLKICEKNGIVYRYPEYESVKKLCEAAGVAFKVVYQAACEAEISE